MKNTSLKFACIFIILIFCIAPLSAIDLNQDDNNKCINQSDDKSNVNLTDVSDVVKSNSSDAAASVDIKSKNIDNATDGIKLADEKDIKIKSDKNLNESEDKELPSPNLKIKVKDIVPGNDVLFEVTGNDHFYGVVHLVLDNNKAAKDIILVNGYALTSFKTDKDFALGKHTIYAYTEGDDFFGNDVASATFYAKEKIIPKVNPHLCVYANSINKGENATVKVFTNTSFDGDVSLKLSNSDAPYKVHVSKGLGKLTIPDLPVGEYTVTANFEETDAFLASEDSTTFSVTLPRPDLKVEVKDFTEDDDAFAYVYAKEGFKGDVTLKISGYDYTYDCHFNGDKNCVSQKIDHLAPGNYTATVSFDGNDDFRADKASASFTVNPIVQIDPNFRVEVKDTMEGRAASVRVYADERYEGPIYIKLNSSDKIYTLYHIKDCAWSLQNIRDLPAGNYTATAWFKGNKKYLPSMSTASFEVISKKTNPDFRVEVKDIKEGRPASVRVYVDEKYEGPINIKLNSSDEVYTVKHNRGSEWSLRNIYYLTPGNYTATASFEGNDDYFSSESSASFVVYPRDN